MYHHNAGPPRRGSCCPPQLNHPSTPGGPIQPPFSNGPASTRGWETHPGPSSAPHNTAGCSHQGSYTGPPPSYEPLQTYNSEPQTTQAMIHTAAKNFVKNQRVRVCLTANVCVAGIILSALQFCQQLFGLGYVVEYIAPDTNMPTTGQFPPTALRP
ncbi:hypothetical protein EW146_g658 [Bondarzewia mesenterica]|uniref:Isochorismatase-like domain-containing protein n=1 Tax=Bondarzewia mesenterica TaxID=1095465 RepID=A0A4S4M690_9AGAM|nr:hypothetical protein EW146_g658 [Bondarzewia mesenterica]